MKKKNKKLNDSKKKKGTKKTINIFKTIIYSTLLVYFFCLFFFIMYNKINNGNIDNTDKVKLEVRYQRDILLKAKNNLNNYDINDESSITIDTKELTDEKEYKKCSGTVKIVRHKDKYEYFPTVNCGKNEVKLQLKSLGDLVAKIFYVDEDFMISSYENTKIDKRLIAGDLILSLYDNNGNLKWISEPVSIYSDKNTYLDVVDVVKLGNYYHVICNKPNYINEHEAEDCIGYYLKYSLDGKLIESSDLIIDGHKITGIEKYVGNNKEKSYYNCYIKLAGEDKYTVSLLYLDNDGLHIFNKDKIKETSKYFKDGFIVADDYIYGLFHDDSRESLKKENETIEYPLSVYKYDINKNTVVKKDFCVEKGEFYTEYVTMVTDDSVYYIYSEENNNSKRHVVKYDKNLNYIKEINYKNYMSHKNQYFFGYAVDENKMFYHYYDNDANYSSEVNFKDEYIKTYELLDEKVFNQYYMDRGLYFDKKIIQMFRDNYGNAIIAFYNK